MSLMDLGAQALAAEVTAGKVTPFDTADAALARVRERNPQLNAICTVNPALHEEARIVADRLEAGEILPLAGVPVVIKDNIWVRGLRITQGSKLFKDFVAPEDAVAVARLRDAGALILGIGTCSEFACKGVTNTPLHGKTRNPVDLSRTTGGSSGGPSAAVAAGMVPMAIGTDAGGSTRRPPAHVGVIGFKPTQDLVPYGPGFDEPVWGISVICPIARHMSDIRLAMEVLAGLSKSGPLKPPFATSADFGLGQALDEEVAEAFCSAVARIQAAGLEMTEDAPDWSGLSGASVMPLQHAGLAALHGKSWQESPDLFDPDLGAQIESGLALTGCQVAQAHQASHRIGEILNGFLARYGAILLPTTPCPAWPITQLAPDSIGGKPCGPRDHAAFTPQANHAGCPAITLPFGVTRNGLPLGLQIISARGTDAALLSLAQDLTPLISGKEAEGS